MLMFNSSWVEKMFSGVSFPLGSSVKKSLHDISENDRATIVPAIIFIFISSSILDLKIHPETECECSWGRIGSHVNTRVNVNAAVREGSTGRIHPLVPGYCKKVLTAESKPQISESRCLFGESV